MQRNAIHFILNYLAPHLTLKDRGQNRKSVESLYLLLVPLIEASRIAHHRRTSNAEAHVIFSKSIKCKEMQVITQYTNVL